MFLYYVTTELCTNRLTKKCSTHTFNTQVGIAVKRHPLYFSDKLACLGRNQE